ncbi:MAG TPA: DUF4350 domain-containing protein, partial [Candidatus Dormibacteraeota bacterium]|nr:DUF4350 domain-containing protein [Candidatus Dormibacteraeota bacterium]
MLPSPPPTGAGLLRRSRLGVVLAGVAAVAVGLLAVFGSGSGASSDAGDPSSRSSGVDGTLALYEWLGDLGLDVHRVSGDFDLGHTDVLFVIAPSEGFTDTEVGRVRDFLRGGGVAVVAVSPATLPAAQPILDSVGLGIDHAAPPGAATPTTEFPGSARVHSVDFADRGVAVGNEGTPLMRTDNDDVVLSSFDVGSGRLDVLGSPYPLSNEGLRATRPDGAGTLQPTNSDAGALVLALLQSARPAGGPP